MPEELLEYSVERRPGQTGKHTRNLQERIQDFWSYVNKNGPIPKHCPELGPCWQWTAGVMKSGGYGQFNINHKMWRTHRLSHILKHGPIADGMNVLHKCDNPRCVRPDHLFLGSYKDNMDDMTKKGRARHLSGNESPVAHLTEATVFQLKVAWATGSFRKAELARMFDTDRSAVGKIIAGQLWKVVPNPPNWPGPRGTLGRSWKHVI